MKNIAISLVLCMVILGCTNIINDSYKYYAQQPPGASAELFAPGIIRHLAHSAPAFSPDGKTMYWSTVGNGGTRKIWQVTYANGSWSAPLVAPFSGQYHDDQPFMSHDGRTLYFASKRPAFLGGPQQLGIWKLQRQNSGWSDPVPLPGFWTPSVTRSGTLYCLDTKPDYKGNCAIFRVEMVNSGYGEPVMLPAPVNLPNAQDWCPYIAPDESYLLFSSDRPGGYGSGDIYISYRNDDGGWGQPVNLGPSVNTDKQERFPGISPDGKYLFFTRWRAQPYYHDLYWIDAGVIQSTLPGQH